MLTHQGETICSRQPNNDDELSWTNNKGESIYPKIEEFHEIVKLHIILSYNVTLDDNMVGLAIHA